MTKCITPAKVKKPARPCCERVIGRGVFQGLGSTRPRGGRLMTRLPVAIVLALVLALAALGCGTSKDETGSTTASAADCTPAQLDTHTKGELTVATDEPAYEPYFVNDEPANGKGFESAVAFAIGKRLGFDRSEVKWTVEPFNSSYAPGPKDFDFDVNEISITPQREKAVDFSAPYYT